MADLSQMSDDELRALAGGGSVSSMSDDELMSIAGITLQPQVKADPKIGRPEEMSWYERLAAGMPNWMAGDMRSSAPGRVMQGMADPVIGGVQLAANLLPDSTGIPQKANNWYSEWARQFEEARKARGERGADGARILGNFLSPANLLLAAKAPMAATKLARMFQGAAVGGGTAALQPVADADGGFWAPKAAQVAGGAVLGAALNPVLGAIGDKVVRRLRLGNGVGTQSAAQTDAAIDEALRDIGQSVADIPPAQLQTLRSQVLSALDDGRQLDPAALARKADFDALGMKGTLGQIARDPRQFTREQRLAGVENVGDDLSLRFQEQGRELQRRLSGPAEGAKDAYTAGSQLVGSLKNTDKLLRREVGARYGEARASTGRDLDVPLKGLAQDYAQILEDFGDKVPGVIRSKMAALGMDPFNPSNQRAMFTMKDADHMQKVINAHVGNDPATNRALGKLRTALRGAIEGADASGGPFAPAVRAASERFRMHDAIPALRAAAEGNAAPDTFVSRFIVNGKTDEVIELAKVLRQADPAAHQEARAQIGDTLRRAAFGENVAGDAPFSAARYMETVRRIGDAKLKAFFSPEEVADMLRVGRVAAYIKQAPNASTVNTSNTASALANLMARTPGGSAMLGLGNRAIGAVKDQSTVRNALAANIPARPRPLSNVEQNYLRYLLYSATGGAGAATGGAIGQ